MGAEREKGHSCDSEQNRAFVTSSTHLKSDTIKEDKRGPVVLRHSGLNQLTALASESTSKVN